MARYFIITLAIAYALIPPGICACRLEAWACSTSPDSQPTHSQDGDDDEDCGCLQIQHDCVIQTQSPISALGQDDIFALKGADLAPRDGVWALASCSFLDGTVPESMPVYLKVRALLI